MKRNILESQDKNKQKAMKLSNLLKQPLRKHEKLFSYLLMTSSESHLTPQEITKANLVRHQVEAHMTNFEKTRNLVPLEFN